ncbi:MAG: OmpA family protein [Oscillospiraceae bacterium]|jgi:chemotaxis protein MotB|nr:OmpA family protein [Oscillospiraceae bacterium]
MFKKSKKHHEEGEMGEAWLLPYSDLMTLLLAVFIVLFAVSKVDESKASEMASQFGGMLQGGSGVIPGASVSVNPGFTNESIIPPLFGDVPAAPSPEPSASDDDENGDLIAQQEMNDLLELQKTLNGYFEADGLGASVTSIIDERGLVVSLSSSVLFDSAKAIINPDNRDLMIKAGNALNKLDNYIRIEGHTDNVPISSTLYPSNLELSAARAIVITNLFIENCDINPSKLIAVGYSEYRPIADNSTSEGRAKNRRVDIIILSSKYNTLENQFTE